jgi:pimeloyl-ACP methyl ester carboxylesterase
VYLQPGDEIIVSVTGLGNLSNKIGSPSSKNYAVERITSGSSIPLTNATKAVNGTALTNINGKSLFYQRQGNVVKPSIVFVHGLGGSTEYWNPLINELGLQESHSLHLFDLEGHGLSPTSPLSALSISSFAADLHGIFEHAELTSSGATVVAHSMGCLVALSFALANQHLVKKLILLGPPPSPLPDAAVSGSYARAHLARTQGMNAVVDAVATAGTSTKTKTSNRIGLAAIRLSLLSQDPEGYAKACSALAGAVDALPIEKLEADTLIITGDEDKVSPPDLCRKYSERIKHSQAPVVLEGVGHWHAFEDVSGVAHAIHKFLGEAGNEKFTNGFSS